MILTLSGMEMGVCVCGGGGYPCTNREPLLSSGNCGFTFTDLFFSNLSFHNTYPFLFKTLVLVKILIC